MPDLVCPDGGRLYYESDGQGIPLLVLECAPGEAPPSAAIDPRRAFGDVFTLITYDQRHGPASRFSLAPFRFDDAAADALAVLDALGIRRALIFATGGGCAIAWRLMHNAPDRVAAAICQEPVGLDGTNALSDYHAPFHEAMRLPRAAGLDGVIQAAGQDGDFAAHPGAGPFAARLRTEPACREELRTMTVERYVALLVRFRDGLWPAGLWPAETPFFSVAAAWMATAPTPMLVLPGAEGDRLHPPGAARLLCQTAPRARCLDIDWRLPERIADAAATVHAFLREHA